jgi:hypothetical protein
MGRWYPPKSRELRVLLAETASAPRVICISSDSMGQALSESGRLTGCPICLQHLFLIGGGLVQCSCATASGHAEPGGCSMSHVSTSFPASIR